MAIQPNAVYNLSPDGENYLTCPSTDGSAATLAALLPSYDVNAVSQIWTTATSGTDLSNIQLTCVVSGGTTYYLTGSGTDGNTLTVTSTSPSTYWSVAANGDITLNGSGSAQTLYANKDTSTPPKPIQKDTLIAWEFNTPSDSLQTGVAYYLYSTNNLLLTAVGTTDKSKPANAELTDHIHTSDQLWTIIGDSPADGVINNAQLKSNSAYFLTGVTSDVPVICNNPMNPAYFWTVVDDGFGIASFKSTHQTDGVVKGYLDNASSTPVLQVTKGIVTQKWKFTKTPIRVPL